MNVDSIQNGWVLDHITAGLGMRIYQLLHLEHLQCPVAIIRNVPSSQMGQKDIIKIDALIDMDFDILGYVDPGITINVIRNAQIVEKKRVELPERLTGVLTCKNPRCITTCEQELPQIFKLTDRAHRVYRCLYCESRAKES